MSPTILILLSFYALTFAIKESVLFDKPRIWLIKLHSFFFYLLECWACTGFWAGIIIYLIANNVSNWNIRELFLWGLASSATSYIVNVVVDKLNRN